MADTLVQRVTGQESADDVNVEVQVVITDAALFNHDDTPAQIPGYGTVPARWVRDLLTPDDDGDDTGLADGAADVAADAVAAPPHVVHPETEKQNSTGTASPPATSATGANRASRDSTASSLGAHARVWLRRLYTHPVTGQLVSVDSTRRTFDGNLRKYLLTRDANTCRTPWCDAPIRHLDHITDHAHAHGGATTATNGQGLCVRCNHTKQTPGFTTRTLTPDPEHPGTAHTVEVATPTGHTYPSTAPPLIPGQEPTTPTRKTPLIDLQPATPHLSQLELYLTHRLAG